MKYVSDFKLFMDNHEKIFEFVDSNPETNMEELVKKPLPTVMAYYNLLPEEARACPAVISMTCLLERKYPMMPLEEK